MASCYIMRRSSLTQQVGSAFGVITASPLMSLLKRMVSLVETDVGSCINNLSILVEENSFKPLGLALPRRKHLKKDVGRVNCHLCHVLAGGSARYTT
jgi:hypothetical protein